MKNFHSKNSLMTDNEEKEITMQGYRMKKMTILVISTILLGLICGCSSKEEKKVSFYNKGVIFYEQGDYIKANIELSNALQLDPDYADAFYMRGMVELKKANPQKAFGNFNSAVAKDPKLVGAQIELIKLYLAARMPDEAEEKIQTVFQMEPQNQEARFLQARLLLGAKKIPESLEILRSLLDAGYKNPEVYQMLAAINLDNKDFAGAEKLLLNGIEKNPQSAELKAYLANVYDMQKRPDEAIAVIKELIELEPDKDVHKIALARLYWKNERKTDVRDFFASILADDPTNIGFWKTVASFYLSVRDTAKAEEILLEGISANQKDFELHFALQTLMVQQGRLDEALEVLQKCLTLDKDPAAPGIIDTHIKLADIYFVQGDIDNAEEQVVAALKENPKSIEGLYLKGRIDMLTDNLDNAVTELRQVVNERPDFIDAHLRLSEALLRNKQDDLALAAMQKAMKENPDDIKLPAVLARLYLYKKDMPAAENVLREVVTKHPDDMRLKIDLGSYYVEQAKHEEAEKVFMEVIEKAPSIAAGYLALGQLYTKQGAPDKAVAIVLRGYLANAESTILFEELIKFNLADNKYDAALDVCREKIKKTPDDFIALNLLGRVYLTKKEFSKAEEAFNKAASLQPQWQDPHNNLATLALMQGKVDAAIEKLQAGIAASPRNGAAYATLGALYAKSGDTAKAIEVYEKALTEIPNDWVSANNLSFLLIEQSSDAEILKRALKLAKLALTLKPENPTVLDTVGWAYQQLGDHQKAIGYIQRALQQNPDQPLLNYHLGMILYSLGKSDEAREKLKKAVESDEEFQWKNKALETLKLLS